MRKITVKYAGECHKCHATLEVGTEAMYEKTTGIFCIGCEPKDVEEIRQYRQARADRKADKYEQWAKKRRDKAHAVIEHNKPFTTDIAFCTQPGYLPFRERILKQERKAYQNIEIAKEFEDKASSLRHVRVKGDAERERQLQRDAIKAVLKPGMEVDTGLYGLGTVKRINKKTATVTKDGSKLVVDLSFIKIV
ncbi:MAG: hypothetical protein M1491_02290 [Deltaproteobacteria bacterium]|nr:hypothetical protein [Deltaproteobacteria bacterium]MCL5276314.1 hypothetical protein [Deltaproteobacteria bacterium]